ncbi:hypothetical protein [Jannaschia sp. W003]|uniref:hypothetical protein n=1 Tax=Jannaschia sp. W003 TaxID=2867012 RepID=UPI0021A88C68|nr:hypothetical protein [Jannaschia sp. W003]UWQ22432.1 hypothetical protein K3554_05215 [Jannaschia sp. W003]
MDATTGIIARFIGLFAVAVEEARMRAQHDSFAGHAARAEDPGPLGGHHPHITSSHQLEGFDPGLDYDAGIEQMLPGTPEVEHLISPPELTPLPADWGWQDEPDTPAAPDVPANPPGTDGPGPGVPPALTPTPVPVPEPTPGPVAPPMPPMPPPGSVATITVQTAALSDADVFGTLEPPDTGSAPGLAHHVSLAAAVAEEAQAAHGVPSGAIAEPGAFGETEWAAGARAVSTDAVAPFGGKAADAGGGGTWTVHVVEDVESHAAKFVDGEAVDALPALPLPAPEEDEDEDDGDAFESEVVTGGNLVVNAVNVTSAWVDAPVIAVMGDAVEVEAISQVAATVDRDVVIGRDADGALAPAAGGGVPGFEAPRSYNAASFSKQESQFKPITEAEGGVAPAGWAIARVEGDLVSYNVFDQQIFVTDTDTVSVTSASSRIISGENVVFNDADLGIFGLAYDVIFVGGDMVKMTTIHQTSVLYDSDTIVLPGAGASVPSGASAAGAAPALATGGNVQANVASLSTVGIDAYASLKAGFEAAGASLAAGGADLSGIADGFLVHGGMPLLALWIAGDFVEVTVVNQMNVLGDSDLVSAARDLAVGAAGEAAKITTGANTQINVASVTDLGIDSEVLVGGELYTDALLHQASLIDSIPDAEDLASEAVAFLADGLVDAADIQEATLAAMATTGGDVDVMQGMLA